MTATEASIDWMCGKDRLYGVVHRPDRESSRGIVIVHGRPAYRIGVHRLFVQLARRWTAEGFPVLRFDYRGAGDCEGDAPSFEETAEDIGSAIDAFVANSPGLRDVVLWASCGGAADAMQYASRDARVRALALINPWSFDVQRRARRKLHYYSTVYMRRMAHWDWWSRILRGEGDLLAQVRSLGKMLRDAAGIKSTPAVTAPAASLHQPGLTVAATRAHLSYRDPHIVEQLHHNLEKFSGKILLILSGADNNAHSFKDLLSASSKWQTLFSPPRVRRHDLPGADHGFRRPEWRHQVESWTVDWLQDL